nr:MAG TPA: glycoprotein [Caudoviricetes sp.]
MDKILLYGPYWSGFIIGIMVTIFYFKLLYTPKRRYYRISWYSHTKKETIYRYLSLENEMSLELYKYLIEEGIVNNKPNLRSNPIIEEIEVDDMEDEYSLKRNPDLYFCS